MSVDLHTGDTPASTRAVCVRAVFHVADDRRAQAVAARMIDGAHQIANLPECECDVDVSVELPPPGETAVADAVALRGPAAGRAAER